MTAPSPTPLALRTQRAANEQTQAGRPAAKESFRGRVLAGRFRLVERLGRGPLGTVYEAIDLELDAFVAVKVLADAIIERPDLMEKVRRQVTKARSIVHPNVCRIYDVNRDGDTHFLVMEYVPGQTLDQEMRGGISADIARTRFLQLLDALQSIHAAGLVHGALHPTHIRVRHDGRLVVTSAGLSCDLLRGTGIRSTHHLCLSPEQKSRKKATVRSDIYAVGKIVERLIDACNAPGSLPRLAPLAERCRQEDPLARFASVPAILEEFERLSQENHPASVPAPVGAAEPFEDDEDIDAFALPLATIGITAVALVRTARRLWRISVPLPLVVLGFVLYTSWNHVADTTVTDTSPEDSSVLDIFEFDSSDRDARSSGVRRLDRANQVEAKRRVRGPNSAKSGDKAPTNQVEEQLPWGPIPDTANLPPDTTGARPTAKPSAANRPAVERTVVPPPSASQGYGGSTAFVPPPPSAVGVGGSYSRGL
ncbi:MAG: serine/threonine protein kinase [Myxococcales bacterium]|nr:serine/threonine protein kinase [Myxococcales bacterium]